MGRSQSLLQGWSLLKGYSRWVHLGQLVGCVHLDSFLSQNISEYAKSGVSSDSKVADVVSE